MVEGSCLCGTVRWRIEPPYERMTHCHCSMCRKAHGAAFATYISLAREGYQLLAGADAIVDFESAPGFHRAFCKQCGAVVPSSENRGWVYAPAGCLDGDPGIRPERHIFAASKAPWLALADSLPRHDAYPDAATGAPVARPARGAGRPGAVGGSCLCGAVAFELTAPFLRVHNCHCSRCRKVRSAAHATNGFLPIEHLHVTRGADSVSLYRLPGARFFAHAFCRDCGSGVPRADPDRGLAVVPLGALDDDPGVGAGRHIFAAYKAPWFEIADDLPRFPEAPPPD